MSERRSLGYFLGKAWLSAFGWKIEGEAPGVRKAVVVAAPHTSAWDFPFTLAAGAVLGVKMSWLGKASLFRGEVRGRLMRWLGGIAVDREKRSDMVGAVVDLLSATDDLFLVLSPEGTRGKATRWKTGFYHMAVGAKVPLVLGYLDYAKKTAGFGDVFYPTGNLDADMRKIRAFYKDVTPKHPALVGEVTTHGGGLGGGPLPTLGPGLFGQSPRWGVA